MDINKFWKNFRSVQKVQISIRFKAKGNRDELVAKLKQQGLALAIDKKISDCFYFVHHRFFEIDECEESIRQQVEKEFTDFAGSEFELISIDIAVEQILTVKAEYSLEKMQIAFSKKR